MIDVKEIGLIDLLHAWKQYTYWGVLKAGGSTDHLCIANLKVVYSGEVFDVIGCPRGNLYECSQPHVDADADDWISFRLRLNDGNPKAYDVERDNGMMEVAA